MRDYEREIAALSAEIGRLEEEVAAIRGEAPIVLEDGALTCGRCGAEVAYGTDRFCAECGAMLRRLP